MTDAAALHNFGCQRLIDGALAEAEAALRAAHALDPADAKTRHALGVALLRQGKFIEGWPFYDARHEVPELDSRKPALPYPEWRGEALAGRKLLIFHEQGFGDQIMYARFARLAAAQGADVTLLCPKPLARLFSQLPVRVVAAVGHVEFPDPDVWVMSSSIAGRFGVTPQTIPGAPYLAAAPRPLADARIGIVWRGNPINSNDANRSLPAHLGERLLRLPGAISLEPGSTSARDFQDTAEIVAGLDEVITVDTAVAHLAGALGKPVRILLPSAGTDWRWLMGRNDTPWYPSARLLRQVDGDWDPLITAIERELGAQGASAPSAAPLPAAEEADARFEMGLSLSEAGQPGDAEIQYARVVELDPSRAEAWANLGATRFQLRRDDAAITAFERALALEPHDTATLQNYARLLRGRGETAAAQTLLARAADHDRSLRVQLAAHLALSPIPPSDAAIDQERARFAEGLKRLESGPPIELSEDPFPPPGFYLAYHGRDDRPFMEQLSAVLSRKVRGLRDDTPRPRVQRRGGRIRVVFLSDLLGASTIGQLYGGVIAGLDRHRFEVIVAHGPRSRPDRLRSAVDARADGVVQLAGPLAEQRRALRDLGADVMFFTDVGMTSGSYLLAASRLAPVQAAGWGHPDTTGMPQIDYFVSCARFEPAGSEAHYSERLVGLPRNPAVFPAPVVAARRTSREALGLPPRGRLYGCPQTLFKLHPEFDVILDRIAGKDPEGWIVIPAADEPGWVEALRARWAAGHPTLAERVWFAPRIPPADFQLQLAEFDVLLDPLHFGSGLTFYLAMGVGTPVVTLPGAFARGRVVAGLYDQMGVEPSFVASDAEDYVRRALEAATDGPNPALRETLRSAARAQLFDDASAVRCLEAFFEAAVDQAALGAFLPRGWAPA